MIQERQEILAIIHSNNTLHTEFENWTINQQVEFLNICTGVKGLKLLYDGFFKEIMNPEYASERLRVQKNSIHIPIPIIIFSNTNLIPD